MNAGDRDNLPIRVRVLAAIRIGIGASLLLAPRATGRLLFFDMPGNPSLTYVARLFAVRNLVLAATLFGLGGEPRERWLRIGAACDVTDAASGLAAARRREISRPTAFLVVGVAVVAAALGLRERGAN